ncbi:MAG TPA: hypothetical protein EYH30_04750 [Anaerolineales bacterium]|nr:hypothetical protein [Anaerolineales bacterium]
MREVDRVAVEEFGLGILQMMENAGRSLAENVLDMPAEAEGEIAVLAGSGGNGGGGLCCARHLHNHGLRVRVVLSREAAALSRARHLLRFDTSRRRSATPEGETPLSLRGENR